MRRTQWPRYRMVDVTLLRGLSQPGKRQGGPAGGTNSASAVDGRYRGSAASGGRRIWRIRAPVRINSASSGVGTAPPPTMTAEPASRVRSARCRCLRTCPDRAVRQPLLRLRGRGRPRSWLLPHPVQRRAGRPPHLQVSCWAPAARAPSASARRCPMVRRSSSHTHAIAEKLAVQQSGVGRVEPAPERGRAQFVVLGADGHVTAGGAGTSTAKRRDRICRSRCRRPARACTRDRASQPAACLGVAASIGAMASVSRSPGGSARRWP